jgi:hypothetical protein
VRELFGGLESREVARQLRDGGLLAALADAAEETGAMHPWLVREARARSRGGGLPLVGWVLEWKAMRVVEQTVEGVKGDPLAVCALKPAVVARLATHKALICELFQRCGRDELRFIVDVGLWGGLGLGVLQMGAWLLWSPKWSLAAGGAAVGYVTNWIALKVRAPARGPPCRARAPRCGASEQRCARPAGDVRAGAAVARPPMAAGPGRPPRPTRAPLAGHPGPLPHPPGAPTAPPAPRATRAPHSSPPAPCSGPRVAGADGGRARGQAAVAEEFAEFMADSVLSPRHIWEALLLGAAQPAGQRPPMQGPPAPGAAGGHLGGDGARELWAFEQSVPPRAPAPLPPLRSPAPAPAPAPAPHGGTMQHAGGESAPRGGAARARRGGGLAQAGALRPRHTARLLA